jgi:hypothetical protein
MPSERPQRHPIVIIVVSQAAGLALVFGGLILFGQPGVLPLMGQLGAAGVAAAAIGYPFGLTGGWLILQVLLPPAAGAALALALPSWVYLAGFVLLLLVFWNAAGGRVPLYLSNRRTQAALAELLPPRAAAADLGCGLGGVIVALGRHRPDARIVGVESAPVPYVLTWLRLKLGGPANVTLDFGDYRARSLAPFDLVYVFLSPVPMADLYRQAQAEMRPGSLLVSNSFSVPDVVPNRTVEVDDGRRTRLYVWEMGRGAEGTAAGVRHSAVSPPQQGSTF